MLPKKATLQKYFGMIMFTERFHKCMTPASDSEWKIWKDGTVMLFWRKFRYWPYRKSSKWQPEVVEMTILGVANDKYFLIITTFQF